MKNKKRYLIGLSLILLTGCATISKDDTMVKFQDSMETMNNLESYTMTGKSQITISMDKDKQEMNIASTLEVNQSNKADKSVHAIVLVGGEKGLEESQGEFWLKEGLSYIDIGGDKSTEEVNEDLILAQTFANNLDFIQSADDYKTISGTNKGNDTEIKFELNDEKVESFFYNEFGIGKVEGLEIKVNDRTMTYLVDKQNNVIKQGINFSIDIVAAELTMTYHFTTDNQYSKFNETKIEYPSNLDSYLDDAKSVDEKEDVFKKKLISDLGYTEMEDDFVILDWGTEIYQFNFAESSFSLIVKEKQFEYHWRDNLGKFNSCVYNHTDDVAEGCTAEDIEQLKLAKEIFMSELDQCGMNLEKLID